MRVFLELTKEGRRGNQIRADTGEVLGEESREVGFWVLGYVGEVAGWSEEGGGERCVWGGDGNEHKGSCWPDVKMVRVHDEIVVFCGRDVKFTPERVDVFLLVVDAGVLHHVIARSRVGSVGADEEVEVHFDFSGSALVVAVGLALGGILSMIDIL